ncbi:cell division protein FtsL [Planococcus lenghuensis]|uniref:Cell division protein FtsL n=1 Tax=Planococcus lenghuensis TaxID=2213202 RepID=A0A1Q2L023_9BACL|nr:cell division protein FtsL [Planococcus lenghuensis]AQQ53799.1 cell division protein FtsL [Planococcus lenghuensis]
MALHAKQQSHIRQPLPQETPVRLPARRKKLITKGEKILYVSFLAMFIFSSILIIQNESSIRAAAQEIQMIEQSVEEVQKQNSDLSVQISELSTYEHIWSEAKSQGLKLNEQNVKVVPVQ